MSLFSVLRIGANGMRAQQFGTQVASHNAANAATEGYSRRTVNMEPIDPRLGARATGERRVVDQFLERRMLGARSSEGEATAKSKTLAILDTVFADGPGSIGEAMDQFQTALEDLSSHPHERAARVVTLERADQLGRAFQNAAEGLATARADVNDRIADEVDQVNDRLREIASLGGRIVEQEVDGSEASDLRDRRDQLVREVADALPVKAIEQDDGSLSLLLAGSKALVSPDGSVNELRASPDATSGDVRIQMVSAGATEDVAGMLTGGRIGGYVKARDGALADARGELDQLAFDLASAYNGVHQAGVGLDGGTGRNLFEPLAGVDGAARNLTLAADVDGQPDRLAAAQDATALPGDNRNALDLVTLADADAALGGTETLSDAYGSLVATAGSAVRSANLELDHASSVAGQVSAMRESVSGVSSDEEMISLMKYQRAYQASLRVIQTADEMLAELVNLKR